MADYRDMYRHLFRETTKAIEMLQEAQRYCEERYLQGEEGEIVPLKQESGALRTPPPTKEETI